MAKNKAEAPVDDRPPGWRRRERTLMGVTRPRLREKMMEASVSESVADPDYLAAVERDSKEHEAEGDQDRHRFCQDVLAEARRRLAVRH